MVEGRMPVGRWVWRAPDGYRSEGVYLGGEKHGAWVVRYPDGSCARVMYRHGRGEKSSRC